MATLTMNLEDWERVPAPDTDDGYESDNYGGLAENKDSGDAEKSDALKIIEQFEAEEKLKAASKTQKIVISGKPDKSKRDEALQQRMLAFMDAWQKKREAKPSSETYFMGGEVARPPSERVPDFMDDSPDPEHEKKPKKPRKRPSRRLRELTIDDLEGFEDIEEADNDEAPSQHPPSSLGDMPYEVREKILGYVLTHDQPIHVHDGWKKVYMQTRKTRQSDPSKLQKDDRIDPTILRTCTALFWEGVRVLYGQNHFIYRLRDPPLETAPPPIDADRLVMDDSPTDRGAGRPNLNADTDEDEGSEYEEEATGSKRKSAQHSRRSCRTKRNKITDGEIHVEKYLPLFRHIVVEAEGNRSGCGTMGRMADAIEQFAQMCSVDLKSFPIYQEDFSAYLYHKETGSKKCTKKTKRAAQPEHRLVPTNIHTLCLRVQPRAVYESTMDKPDTFTFVNFFATGSSVVSALISVLPQFIRVEIDTLHLDGSGSTAYVDVDLRYKRIKDRVENGEEDMWAEDGIIIGQREMRAHGSEEDVRSMHRLLLERCLQHYDKDLISDDPADVLGELEDNDLQNDEGVDNF